jgi:hypothetical protein
MTVSFNDSAGDRLKGAWYGKAKMAFTQLKMKAVANPTLAPYIADYEHIYGVKAKKPMPGQTKLFIGLVAFFIGILIFAGIMASGESKDNAKEKNRLDAIVQRVHSQIAAGQYDAAEASCAEIHWTWDLNRCEAEAKAYDREREGLKTLIDETRKNPNKR